MPVVVLNALEEVPVPIYGTGANMRGWTFVDDQVRALEVVIKRGEPGQAYEVAPRVARSNLQVARSVCQLLDGYRPRQAGRRYEDLITFVPDRQGHDRRYALESSKMESELGWSPLESFESGLTKTVKWYIEREDWWRPLRSSSNGHGR